MATAQPTRRPGRHEAKRSWPGGNTDNIDLGARHTSSPSDIEVTATKVRAEATAQAIRVQRGALSAGAPAPSATGSLSSSRGSRPDWPTET